MPNPVTDSPKKPVHPEKGQTGTQYGSEIVGRRCKVFWRDDKAWYKGMISRYDDSLSKHLVEYDDGDTEWLNLTAEKFELAPLKTGMS
jgi:DNA mismatch repair protein MSH6